MFHYILNNILYQYKKDIIDWKKKYNKILYKKPIITLITFISKDNFQINLIKINYLFYHFFNQINFFKLKNQNIYLYTKLKYKKIYFFLLNIINNQNIFLKKKYLNKFYFLPLFKQDKTLYKIKNNFNKKKIFINTNIYLNYFYKLN